MKYNTVNDLKLYKNGNDYLKFKLKTHIFISNKK